MKLLFSELHQSDFSGRIVHDGWFPVEEIDLVGVPEGRISASLSGSNRALIAGTMTFTVKLPCDRCCELVQVDLTAEFNYECIVGSDDEEEVRQELECRKEDLNRIYLKEPVVDTGELCREQVFLALPSRILCDNSCKGLCQNCGADLNRNECGCENDTNASPFSILSKLSNR